MPHIMELVGKTRVAVKDGKVVEVGEPEVAWCPVLINTTSLPIIPGHKQPRELK